MNVNRKNFIYATAISQVVCAICVAFYTNVYGGNPYVLVEFPLILLAWPTSVALAFLTWLMVKSSDA